MKRSIVTILALLSLALLLPVLSYGQAISGDLTGVVKDASGAYVADADVEITNLATGFKQTSKTNAQGEYRFANLPVGHYSVDVNAPGMKGGYRDVEVVLNKAATANITAAVVSAGTTVEVNEQAVAIDTTTPTISQEYGAKQIAESPLATAGTATTSSGVLNLSLLDAGVATSGGIGAGSGPSVGGQRPRNNNFTIEGVDNNSLSTTGPLIVIPNDAVESFTVLQNDYSAEFGHSSGGQFNQTIKSGTNQFHGTAYEYFQNRDLNAEDSQVALTQAPGPYSNPRYDNNRFGGNFGGPIIKNKLFFFTDWEYNPIGQVGSPNTFCAPTSTGYSMLSSLFPGSNNLAQLQKYAGTGGTANVCPSTLNVAQGVATNDGNGDFPTGTPTFAVPIGDIGVVGPSYQNTLSTANSFDYNISEKDQLRGRLAWVKLDGFDTAASLPEFWITLPQRFWVATLSEYHNFSPNINNELRFGFNRYSQFFPVGPQSFPGLDSFPNLLISQLNQLNIGPDPNAPQTTVQNQYQFVDNVSWVKGKHNLRMGGELRWIISPQTFTQRVRGDYEWNALSDYLNDFASFPTSGGFSERSSGNTVYYGNKKAYYAYVNDDWRVSPTITLNLGLRYEYTGNSQGLDNQSLNAISSVPGLLVFNNPSTQTTNFMPRVGIAWAPTPNTSVNVGYAMANDVLYDNLGILSQPPQLQQTCDVVDIGQPQPCPYSPTHFLGAGGLPSTPAPITDPATGRAATSAYIPNQTLPYSETWTAGVQHIFANKYTMEVRYVGTRGIHLSVQTHLNNQAPVTPTNSLPTFLTAPSQAYLNSLSLTLDQLSSIGNVLPAFANAGFTNQITSFQPWGYSNYNGLQVSFKRNFTNGLQFQAAWTWSHTFDNSTADVFSTVLTPRRPQDFSCFACDYGTSALDHRHRVTIAATYDLPFFKNSNWMMKNVVGNWQFSPIYTFQSPEYATVQSGTDSNLNGDSASDRAALFNAAGAPNTASTVTPLMNSAGAVVAYVADNPNAQYIAAGSGVYGSVARNTLVTPDINNWDFALLKRLNITERQQLQFIFQATNIFNHAQYVPGLISDVQSFGQSSGTVRGALLTNSPTFAQWNQVFTNHPRNLVLVLKYSF
ncbi:MAG: TonB-dependent receptor [Candidatus Korobacteraceae bacterium]